MQHSIQSQISKVLAEHQPRILFGYLFGSADTPLEHPRSDLDIAVYFQAQPEDLALEHKLDLYTALSRATKRNRIDIVVLNTCKNQILLFEILTQGRIVHDASPKTRAIFEQQAMHSAIDFKQQRDRIFA
ncbi:MAG: type VII toxin-antitoxin system MntA family adenylyltransferase antitoxin [Desulfohalobiaceae bacterium]